MSWFTDIFSNGVANTIDSVGEAIDRNFTSDEERLNAEIIREKIKADTAALIRSHLAKMREQLLGALKASDDTQAEINKVEAQSGSLWRAGWRPLIGWGCALGVCYQFVLRPLLQYGVEITAWSNGVDLTGMPKLPELDWATLGSLTFGILGLGAYRTIEKLRGIS